MTIDFMPVPVRTASRVSNCHTEISRRRAFLIAFGLALALPAAAQSLLPTETFKGTAAGRSSGLARVGSFGEANYVMPLWVAPGRVGMQPALGLAYSSTTGNGLLGVGWALTGLSKITRCPRTWLQEGEAKAVRFVDGDGGDRYCLDGQRLILVGGANGVKSKYGEHESEYRTERDTQIKVVAFQTNAQGPRFFRAYLKDGKILTFGATADARLEGRVANSRLAGATGYPPRYTVETTYDHSVVAAWALSRIEDRSGNFLTVRYGVDEIAHGYEQFPVEIAYTGHDGDQPLAPTRLVQFTYGSRPDASEQFSGGLRTVVTRRLTQIQVHERSGNRTELLREYRLVYRTSTLSRRSLLANLTECDGQGVCLKPTTLQWSEPTPNLQLQDLGAFSASGNASAPNSQAIIHTGDINGDGLDDALLRESQGQTWQFRLSNTTALGGAQPGPSSEPRDPNAGAQAREAEGRLVDLDADGHADFMVRERPRSGGGASPPELFRSQIYRATDTGFQQFPDPLDTYTRVYRESYVLDLDGDGLPDLAKPIGEAGAPGGLRWAARRNLGGAFDEFKTSEVSYRAQGPLTFWPVEALAIDIEGRGAQDLVIEFSAHGATALRWDGGEFKSFTVPTLLTKCRPLFADINGDGLIDQLDLDSSQGVIRVAINTGRAFLAAVDWSVPAPFDNSPALHNPGGCTSDYDAGVRVVDFNGDGKDDLMLLGGYVDGGVRRLAVLESTGTGFAPRGLAIPVQLNAPTPNGWRTAQTLDVNGDGLPDFVTATGGRLLLYTRQSLPNDYLLTATDGLGRYDHFTYSPFVKLHDQGTGGVCRYPLACTRRGPWLVAEHTADSGTKTGRRHTYRYHDGRHDLAGRGWLGFGRVEYHDQQSGQHVQERFDNTTRVETFYPCAGFSVARESAAHLLEAKTTWRIHRTTVTRQCQLVLSGLPSARHFFSYANRTRLVEEEFPVVGGTAAGVTKLREVELRETHDAFDNVTLAEQQIYPVDAYGALGRATVWRRATRYDNHVGSWLIGRPAHVEITQAARSGRSVVTVVAAQFDDQTGLLARLDEAGWSGDADPARATSVVTTFERNAFGLPVRLVQRDGADSRTVTLDYDGEQMFVALLVNPEGHRASATYHSGRGLPLRQVDLNG
ncbi:MAG: hypothetical protein HZC22_17140, partial [Rhodocyclales bacterium]|nr:hypothetical protein [Rhodocyclales bacterium]